MLRIFLKNISFAYQDIFENAGYTKVTDVDAISEATSEKVFGTYLIDAKAAPMSAEAAKVGGLVVGGRLGEYRYYDMDQSIGKALELSAVHFGS